jgi:hypothetical protein
MISGMGIPATFLQYADEMEFARSVSMMNGMFLRMIVSLQKTLGENFSNIYRKLYHNEFETAEDAEDEDFMVDYSKIEAKFPPPASLNMTNMADQIGNTQGIVDFIVTTIVGNAGEDSSRDKLTKEITKKLLPNIEWDEYEKVLNETTIEEVSDNLKKINSDTEEV